jgi:hypothetical protein
MRQLSADTMPARALSTAGTWGEIQIVPCYESIVLDVQARNYDTSGHLHRDHALASLSLTTAIRLHALLGQAIQAAVDVEPRQPGLWSEATMRGGALRRRA